MKKIYLLLTLSLLFILGSIQVQGATLTEKLSGRILLQVEENGEAWYVNPVNRLRYFLGRPADAFRIMQDLGLGISEADYDLHKESPPARLLGRIVLRVERGGEAYYADPLEKEFVYLGRPADAFEIMEEKGLGVSNDNLNHMPISGASTIPPGDIMNITMKDPSWNEEIFNPVNVNGEARVFENAVNIRVRDANDKIIAEAISTAMAADVGEFGSYMEIISYSDPETKTGYVEAYHISAKDGSEIYKVITLVRF